MKKKYFYRALLCVLCSIQAISFTCSGTANTYFKSNNPNNTPPFKNQSINNMPTQESGISFFVGTWEQATEVAAFLNKPIFLYLYKPNNESCRKLQEDILNKASLNTFFEDNFFSIKINVNSTQGKAIAQQYAIVTYPALLFFTPNGQLMRHDNAAVQDTYTLLNMAQNVLDMSKGNNNDSIPDSNDEFKYTYAASNIENTEYDKLHKYEMQYNTDTNNADFLCDFIYLSKKFNNPYAHLADEYLKSLSEEEKMDSKNIFFMYDLTENIYSITFPVFVANRTPYNYFLGEKLVIERIKNAIKASVIMAATCKDSVEYSHIGALINNIALPNKEAFEINMQALYLAYSDNWTEYAAFIANNFENGNLMDANELNEAAWKIANYLADEIMLKKALLWTKRAIAQNENEFKYHETYAALLYRLGKTNDAIKEAENAIQIAMDNNQDYNSTLLLIDLIKKTN